METLFQIIPKSRIQSTNSVSQHILTHENIDKLSRDIVILSTHDRLAKIKIAIAWVGAKRIFRCILVQKLNLILYRDTRSSRLLFGE